mmetsp:Transcript_19234/g.55168  ORF Transcript_19234/g.55168 Transcript_19234/m.55168 type:complete len:238 (+) Transcript_19234:847-1560(+)
MPCCVAVSGGPPPVTPLVSAGRMSTSPSLACGRCSSPPAAMDAGNEGSDEVAAAAAADDGGGAVGEGEGKGASCGGGDDGRAAKSRRASSTSYTSASKPLSLSCICRLMATFMSYHALSRSTTPDGHLALTLALSTETAHHPRQHADPSSSLCTRTGPSCSCSGGRLSRPLLACEASKTSISVTQLARKRVTWSLCEGLSGGMLRGPPGGTRKRNRRTHRSNGPTRRCSFAATASNT